MAAARPLGSACNIVRAANPTSCREQNATQQREE